MSSTIARREHRVETTDGRTLRVLDDGDASGVPVVYHHGTPGCAGPEPTMLEQAMTLGIRLISYDRPGYGASSRLPGRRYGDCVGDVATMADHLGIERFGSFGVSGGGPHTLACAALLGDRVTASVSSGSPAPFDADGLDWGEGMGDLNADEIAIAARGYDALYEHIAGIREELLASTPEQGKELMASLLSPVDRDALTDELTSHMHANAMEALAPGAEGWTDESLAEFAPWGFDLETIAVPVQIWHGDQDRFVPVGHARWLAAQIPGAEPRIFPDEGHISLVEKSVGEMLGWLVERA